MAMDIMEAAEVAEEGAEGAEGARAEGARGRRFPGRRLKWQKNKLKRSLRAKRSRAKRPFLQNGQLEKGGEGGSFCLSVWRSKVAVGAPLVFSACVAGGGASKGGGSKGRDATQFTMRRHGSRAFMLQATSGHEQHELCVSAALGPAEGTAPL